MSEEKQKINTRAVLHEFIGMTLFVYIGCGVAEVARGTQAWNLQVAFAFGMAIMVLVYAIGASSGGQLNWAVTAGLMVEGSLYMAQGFANMLAQLFGAILGAAFLYATLPDSTSTVNYESLGSNSVAANYTDGQAFLAEFLMTFLLVFVVFQTAVDPKAITGSDDVGRPVTAPLAIGFAVFLAHLVCLPITGCSINPPRSFGPALVATIAGESGLFDDYWIFFVAPMLGGVVAGILHKKTKETHEIEGEVAPEEDVAVEEDASKAASV